MIELSCEKTKIIQGVSKMVRGQDLSACFAFIVTNLRPVCEEKSAAIPLPMGSTAAPAPWGGNSMFVGLVNSWLIPQSQRLHHMAVIISESYSANCGQRQGGWPSLMLCFSFGVQAVVGPAVQIGCCGEKSSSLEFKRTAWELSLLLLPGGVRSSISFLSLSLGFLTWETKLTLQISKGYWKEKRKLLRVPTSVLISSEYVATVLAINISL